LIGSGPILDKTIEAVTGGGLLVTADHAHCQLLVKKITPTSRVEWISAKA
jgi:hypothetical protein